MPDQSMLVFYPAASGVIGLWSFMKKRIQGAHSCLSLHAGNPSFELPTPSKFQSPKYPPLPLEFQFREPFAFGNHKSHLWYRYGYFLELPIIALEFLYRV